MFYDPAGEVLFGLQLLSVWTYRTRKVYYNMANAKHIPRTSSGHAGAAGISCDPLAGFAHFSTGVTLGRGRDSGLALPRQSSSKGDSALPPTPKAFIFMKVGSHAGESIEGILERKRRALTKQGRIFWAYTNTPDPVECVQRLVEEEKAIEVLMPLTRDALRRPRATSAASAAASRPAKEFSCDGITWKELPPGDKVTVSRWALDKERAYALVLGEIKREQQLTLNLGDYKVWNDPKGRNGAEYLKGQSSKACLVETSDRRAGEQVRIYYRARLVKPYAVMLR